MGRAAWVRAARRGRVGALLVTVQHGSRVWHRPPLRHRASRRHGRSLVGILSRLRRLGQGESGRAGYDRSEVLGWTLLVLGVLLATWRLMAHISGQGPHSAVLYAAPVGRATVPRMIPTPMPSPTSSPYLAVSGGPSLAAGVVDSILAAYGSPLHGHGAGLVALSNRYGLDDAVALGFFVMESRAGTEGEAVVTRSFGNLRPMPDAAMRDGYRSYGSWLESAAEWFSVIRSLYLDRLKLGTVEEVVPIYAPASDSNDPGTMTAGIRQLVSCWRGTPEECPADPPALRALALAERARHTTVGRGAQRGTRPSQ